MGTSTLLFMMPFSVIPCATERNGAFKFLAVTGTDSLFLGDDAMGVQGSQARLAGMLAGGVWFRVVRAAVIISRVPVVVIAAWWTKLRRTSRDLNVQGSEGP